MINIKDIRAIQERRIKRQKESFEVILSNCFKQIKKQVEMFPYKTFFYFDVPEFMLGYPLYKLEDCLMFLIDNIKHNGYQVQYIFPRILLISWAAHSSNLLEYSNQNKQQQSTVPVTTQSTIFGCGIAGNSNKKVAINNQKKPAIKSSKVNPKTGKFILNLN